MHVGKTDREKEAIVTVELIAKLSWVSYQEEDKSFKRALKSKGIVRRNVGTDNSTISDSC